jgi:hypothetical protein
MAIYKIFSEADSTIYSRYPTKNAGLDEILEISVKNNDSPQNDRTYLGNNSSYGDDIRRSVIKFSNRDLQKIDNLHSGNYKTYFKAYIARAENLSQNYYLEFSPLNQFWTMGTGKFQDFPDNKTGVSWYQTGSYRYNVNGFPIINWNLTTPNDYSYFLVSGGGSWNSSLTVTQSFDYQSSKDIEVDITSIYENWISTVNNGLIIKHPRDIENNSGSFMMLNYFSNDTHTIYPPTLEMRWDDSNWDTGSLQIIESSDTIITIANNLGNYSWNNQTYRFRVNARDKFPARTFTTQSFYTMNKALPQNSYWSIVDAKTNDIVIGYDYEYTKISCDPTSSYFTLYMNGLEPERYYKIFIQSELGSGKVIDWDSDLIFKVTK